MPEQMQREMQEKQIINKRRPWIFLILILIILFLIYILIF